MKQTSYIVSTLPQWDLKDQTVLVRIDGDVPVKNGAILDDSRLFDCLPTLQMIKSKGGKIVLLTHMGRPVGYQPELSTKQLLPWFAAHGFTILFAPTPKDAQNILNTTHSDIILLENLRLDSREQHATQLFAQELAKLGAYYVNESFATSHRADCSMTLLPEQFDEQHRTLGLHCAQEVTALQNYFNEPQRPYLAILGGGKVADKLPIIQGLLVRADHILLCPALVFTFLKAQGISIGDSLVADEVLENAQQILQHPLAQEKLIFPVDYQVAQGSINGELSVVDAHEIAPRMVGIAIGPQSVALYSEYIRNAKTIFFNGPMGFIDKPATLQATCQLLTAMSQSNAHTVIGGGDSAACAQSCNVTNDITYISSGGGAALAFVSGNSLPGLRLFMRHDGSFL